MTFDHWMGLYFITIAVVGYGVSKWLEARRRQEERINRIFDNE